MRKICFSHILILATIASTSSVYGFCFTEAAAEYGIAPELPRAISKLESGHNPNAVNFNSNGTYDYGLMGINTVHASELQKINVSWESLSDPCTNVMAGTWLLSKHIKQYGYTWEAIGAYHSKTPSKRDIYARNIAKIIQNNAISVRAANKSLHTISRKLDTQQ